MEIGVRWTLLTSNFNYIKFLCGQTGNINAQLITFRKTLWALMLLSLEVSARLDLKMSNKNESFPPVSSGSLSL